MQCEYYCIERLAMKPLPTFKPRPRELVVEFITEVMTLGPSSDRSYVNALIEHGDGHYRVLFDPAYFVLPAGQSQPSKSQWNNLKKRMKRHEPLVFVFKEHGDAIGADGRQCCYLDFGFFAQ